MILIEKKFIDPGYTPSPLAPIFLRDSQIPPHLSPDRPQIPKYERLHPRNLGEPALPPDFQYCDIKYAYI
ncbi:hypothetical protein Hanom_Chr13g01199851 [Helianthus anomalus]